jgi:hypothetical protein
MLMTSRETASQAWRPVEIWIHAFFGSDHSLFVRSRSGMRHLFAQEYRDDKLEGWSAWWMKLNREMLNLPSIRDSLTMDHSLSEIRSDSIPASPRGINNVRVWVVNSVGDRGDMSILSKRNCDCECDSDCNCNCDSSRNESDSAMQCNALLCLGWLYVCSDENAQ